MLFYIIYYLCISSENLFIHLGTHLVLACIAICVCPRNLLNYYKKIKKKLPRQILLKVSTLGLATEKYTQIAVVLVSAKCSPDHRECTKMCLRAP